MTSIQTLNRLRSIELLRLLRDFQVGERYDCILAEEVMGWERIPDHYSSPTTNVPAYRVLPPTITRYPRYVQYGPEISTWQPTSHYPHAKEAFIKANVTSDEWIFVCDQLTEHRFSEPQVSSMVAYWMSLAALIKHRKLFPDFCPKPQTGITPI